MAKGQKPDYVVSYVVEGPRGQKLWHQVGAAWKHQNGDGLSLSIQSIPVNFNGELVLRPPYSEEDQMKDAA